MAVLVLHNVALTYEQHEKILGFLTIIFSSKTCIEVMQLQFSIIKQSDVDNTEQKRMLHRILLIE